MPFSNSHKTALFCCSKCATEYHFNKVKYKDRSERCELCNGLKENSERKYCNHCEEIVNDFDINNNLCYICHKPIEYYSLKHYSMYGRRCKKCLNQKHEKK